MICFMFIYLCDIDDDVAGGVDDEEEVIQLRQSVCPGRPVPDVFKPKHLKKKHNVNVFKYSCSKETNYNKTSVD